jgi:ubiquitin-protein ligase
MSEQHQRLLLENQILHQEGFTQFSIYTDDATGRYYVAGYTNSSSGRSYRLYISIPSGYPQQRPAMYITDPLPLKMRDGTLVTSLGISHNMHTLAPSDNGMVQICHWRDDRWHSGILLHKVILKGLIWIEAYEQHLATGHPLADFVRTMVQA